MLIRSGALLPVRSRAFLSIGGRAFLSVASAALLLVRSHSLILSMALLARLVSSIPTKHSRREHDQSKTNHSKLKQKKLNKILD